ncbi:Wzz/FepE/Etk N-terminal domain-containing protein [Blastococcus aurantiacus]
MRTRIINQNPSGRRTVDLAQLLRAVRRRWYVVLPLTLITIVLAFAVRAGVQPGYTVTGSVIVLPPGAARVATSEGIGIEPVNPLLNFNSSTQISSQALAILASGPEFRERAAAGSTLATYSVVARERQPIVDILVESKSRETALDTASRVIVGLGQELSRQQPLPTPESQLTIKTLAQPSVAAVDNSRLRSLVVALGAGLLLTLGLTVLVDALAIRRGRPAGRRHASTSTKSDELGQPSASLNGQKSPGDKEAGQSSPDITPRDAR